MLNTEPIVNVPIDHSVALDVKEGDYFGINVKYAKKAGEVEHLPELKKVPADADVVYFTIGDKVYEKRIDEVQHASVAVYDTKGRKLADMLNEADYEYVVQSYLDNKELVQSVNSMTGNVVITKAGLGLGNVDNTSDADKPISTAVQNALDTKQAVIAAGSNIRIDNGNVINALVDFSPLEARIDAANERIAANTADISSISSALNEFKNETETALTSANTEITGLKANVTSLTDDLLREGNRISSVAAVTEHLVAEIAGKATVTEVDAKIAEAMAGEQAQDDALKARLDSLENALTTEMSDRAAGDTALRTDYTTAINSAVGEIRVALEDHYTKSEVDALIAPLQNALDGIDLSEYYNKTESDARFVSLAEYNAKIAYLEDLIERNVGRVLTADPHENNRVWVEQ